MTEAMLWACFDAYEFRGKTHVARIGPRAGGGIKVYEGGDMVGDAKDFERLVIAVNNFEAMKGALEAAQEALTAAEDILSDLPDDDGTVTPTRLQIIRAEEQARTVLANLEESG